MHAAVGCHKPASGPSPTESAVLPQSSPPTPWPAVPGMVPGAVAPIYTAGVSQPSQRPIRGVPMLAAVSHLLLHVASAFTV